MLYREIISIQLNYCNWTIVFKKVQELEFLINYFQATKEPG